MLTVSALNGTGLDRLVEILARRLVAEPPAPAPGVPLPARSCAKTGNGPRTPCETGETCDAVDRLREFLTG